VLLSERPAVPTDHPLRPALDARYLDMRAAMASRDRARILALFTPDFVSEDIDGRTIGASTLTDRVTALDIDRSKRTVSTTITAIDAHGDEAVVLQRYAMSTTERLPNVAEALWTESEDVWRCVDETWLSARTTTLAIETIRAGRHRMQERLVRDDPVFAAILEGPSSS
jgi:ketosteroid isomerase-like protein